MQIYQQVPITADTVTVNTATINGQLNLEDIEINDNYTNYRI